MGNKEALLVGARRCIEEIGYSRTTARDLVAASHTNLASIGYHYGSKETLLDEAIAQAFYEWTDQAVSVALADSDGAPLERLLRGWELMLNSFGEHRGLLVSFVEAAAQAQHRPALQSNLQTQYQHSRKRLKDEIVAALGSAAENNPAVDTIASLVIAVSDGFALQWICDPEGTPTGSQLVEGLMVAASLFFGATNPSNDAVDSVISAE